MQSICSQNLNCLLRPIPKIELGSAATNLNKKAVLPQGTPACDAGHLYRKLTASPRAIH